MLYSFEAECSDGSQSIENIGYAKTRARAVPNAQQWIAANCN